MTGCLLGSQEPRSLNECFWVTEHKGNVKPKAQKTWRTDLGNINVVSRLGVGMRMKTGPYLSDSPAILVSTSALLLGKKNLSADFKRQIRLICHKWRMEAYLWTGFDHASQKAPTCCLLHLWAFIWYNIHLTSHSKMPGKMGDWERPVTATSPSEASTKANRVGSYSAVKWSKGTRNAIGFYEWSCFPGFTKSACTLRKLWTNVQSWSFARASTEL